VDSCCGQCGINHEARDFVRAMVLHLLDHFERNDKFIEFMKNNEFLDVGALRSSRNKNATLKKIIMVALASKKSAVILLILVGKILFLQHLVVKNVRKNILIGLLFFYA
jgi:hypothetical protein